MGGYTCRCFPGFSGNGYSCAPAPSLKTAQATYSTPGPGQVGGRAAVLAAAPRALLTLLACGTSHWLRPLLDHQLMQRTL